MAASLYFLLIAVCSVCWSLGGAALVRGWLRNEPEDKKCCSNGCGPQCTAPYTVEPKPGVCPNKTLEVGMVGACVESCSHDSDCPNDEKCCSNGCGHQCSAPYTDP
ncbi:antileukoproteinase-like isoform X2 [Siphateles boraxobius]|uniref:antileukoproteinase-like isoform X2 n=1 Tax=Siphateles boraxobius TaxID=180520 RepID=UPI004063B3FA